MRVTRSLALFSAAQLLLAACLATAAPIQTTPLPASPQSATAAPATNAPTPAAPTLTASATAPTAPTMAPVPATPSSTATVKSPPAVTPVPAVGSEPTGPTQEARVVRIVDGDTIRVQIGGQEFPLRYIGIDTPETVHPSRPVEWMGREASDANRALVEGRVVVLEKDVSETDRFGRLLRHVWLPQDGGWLLVNRELVRLGFAQASTYPPDVKYTDLYLDAQRAARDAERGLWGDPPDDEDDPPADGGGGLRCDPSYPGVCIPSSPPDLDCGDISPRRFTVLPPDPHRFDSDHDGIGCESG